MAAGHVRRGLCLVDEDEALRIEIELVVEPVLALLQDVGPILLNRMPGHFLRVIPRRAKEQYTVPTRASCSVNSTWLSIKVMSPCSASSWSGSVTMPPTSPVMFPTCLPASRRKDRGEARYTSAPGC